MANKKPKGNQLVSNPDIDWQVTINLDQDEKFVNSQGVDFIHYKAVPSSVGIKERGDYRKVDAADISASNGFKYICAGEFTAAMVSNNKNKNAIDGGLFDESVARLIMPRFYNKNGQDSGGKRIHLAPGDRVYIKDADVEVPNWQKMTYNPNGTDQAQFPITCVEYLEDSQGIEYIAGRHFKVNSSGNIEWLPGQKNPGIDPDTGKGRVYSIRYLYNAHYYILSIPNELRVGRVTEGGIRKTARMPYYAVVQREYVYHNQVNSQKPENTEKKTKRTKEKPDEIAPSYTPIKVNMNIVDDE
jgi:hypothetical protein